MNTNGYPVDFDVTLSSLIGNSGYSQLLPDEEPSGYVTEWNNHADTFRVLINVPEWVTKETYRRGFQVVRPDQIVLWMSRRELDNMTNFRFNPDDFTKPDEFNNLAYSKALTLQTLKYMGLI